MTAVDVAPVDAIEAGSAEPVACSGFRRRCRTDPTISPCELPAKWDAILICGGGDEKVGPYCDLHISRAKAGISRCVDGHPVQLLAVMPL